MGNTIQLLEPYPTRDGLAIPALELELLETELELPETIEVSNHHDYWTRRKFGRQVLYTTLRNLEICQTILPQNMHDLIHKTYEPPELPRPYQAYQFILEAFNNGVKTRLGSANNPLYEPISEVEMERIHQNYKKLKCM